jgi:hypothetical protein
MFDDFADEYNADNDISQMHNGNKSTIKMMEEDQ